MSARKGQGEDTLTPFNKFATTNFAESGMDALVHLQRHCTAYPWVTGIETNIKCASGATRTVTIPRGKHLLLVGPVGSGKSAITEAIQLALTGTTSDVMLRDDVKAFLPALAPEGEALVAKVTWSDGSEAIYLDGKHEKTPTWLVPSKCLPVRDVRACMLKGVQATREFFLGRVPSVRTMEELMAKLPGAHREKFKVGLTKVSVPWGNGMAGYVAAVLEWAEGARNTKAKAARDSRTILETWGDVVEVTTTRVEACRQAWKAYREVETILSMLNVEIPREVETAERLDREIKELDTRIQGRRVRMAARPAAGPSRADRIQMLRSAVQVGSLARQVGEATCPVCGADAFQDKEVSEYLDAQAAKAAALLAATPETDEHMVTRGERQLAGLRVDLKRAEDALEGMLHRLDSVLVDVGDPATWPVLPPKPVDTPEGLAIKKDRYDRAGGLRRTIKDAEEEVEDWEPHIRAFRKLQKDMAEEAVPALEQAIARWFPPWWGTPQVMTKVAGRQAFWVGLRRSGRTNPVAAWSGCEGEAIQVAAAIAISGDPTLEYRLIMPEEDRRRDIVALRQAMTTLAECPHQVVMESTEDPRTAMFEGDEWRSPQWHIVCLEGHHE